MSCQKPDVFMATEVKLIIYFIFYHMRSHGFEEKSPNSEKYPDSSQLLKIISKKSNKGNVSNYFFFYL